MKRNYSNKDGIPNANNVSRNINTIDKDTLKHMIKIRSLLYKSISQPIDADFYVSETKTIKKFMDNACRECVSTSMMIVGTPDSNKKELVYSILESCKLNKKDCDLSPPISIGTINGLVHGNDADAIKILADQFLLRSSTENRHFNLAVEDLIQHFTQCRINRSPAVIVIEEIDVFTKKEKQVLIYTLLDLMHREDLLFVMIGLTSAANIHLLLEKRTLSRLNAQFVYITPPNFGSVSDILEMLAKRFMTPLIDMEDVDNIVLKFNRHDYIKGNNSTSCTASVSEITGVDFMHQFVSNIGDLFGRDIVAKINLTLQLIKTANYTATTTESSQNSLVQLVNCYLNWGYNYDYFLIVSLGVISKLSSYTPYITKEMFESTIKSLHAVRTIEILSSLTPLELTSSVAVYRLTVNRVNQSDITVQDILIELKKITGMMRQNDVVESDIYCALHTLEVTGMICTTNASPNIGSITKCTYVQLVIPVYLFRSAFTTNPSDIDEHDTMRQRTERVYPILKLTERLRRLVLIPDITVE